MVSCIVPVFNGERFLREALDSIVEQTHRPLEVVVVDDGSTDNTPQIAASYRDVRLVRQANAGPAAARNRGLRETRGQLVAFLDADDLWRPEKLERQVGRFIRRAELGLCFTHGRNFWAPELREEEARLREHRIARPMPIWLPSTLLARRRVFDAVGGFDESLRFGHSTEWLLRARAEGIVVEMVPEVLYRRRLHGGNRSRRMSTESRDEFLRIVKAHADRQARR